MRQWCLVAKNLLLVVSAIAFLMLPGTTSADTLVSGTISLNTTWALADSPITVVGNVIINSGVTLTIESGVEVRFAPDMSLIVQGALIARGTATSPITFTSSDDTTPWGFIKFENSSSDATFDANGNYISGSVLEHCTVEYGNSIGDGAIWAISASPFINTCTFRNNSLSQTGSNIDHTANTLKFIPAGGMLRITNNQFLNNRVAIDVTGSGSAVLIDGNTFDGNSYEAVELQGGGSTVTISNNVVKNGGGASNALNLNNGGGSGVILFTNNQVINNARSMEIGGTNVTITDNLFLNTTSQAIEMRGQNPTISNNAFINNTCSEREGGAGCALYGDAVNPLITNNKFHGNKATSGQGAAIALRLGGTITNNTFSGNTGNSLISRYQEGGESTQMVLSQNNFLTNDVSFLVYLINDGLGGANAENNWWGTTSQAQIQALIRDFADNATLATVDFSPFLTQPSPEAPPSPPVGVAAQTGPTSIVLTWLPNTEPDIAGYKLHYDTDGYPYANTIDLGNVTTFTLTGLTTGTTYHLALSAYDSNNNESWLSNETQSTIVGSAPTPTPTATFSPTPTPTATITPTPTPTSTPTPVAGPSLTGWGIMATGVTLGILLMIMVSRRLAPSKRS